MNTGPILGLSKVKEKKEVVMDCQMIHLLGKYPSVARKVFMLGEEAHQDDKVELRITEHLMKQGDIRGNFLTKIH